MAESGPPLPLSVENLLQQICSERSLPFPDPRIIAELAGIGEQKALQVLWQVRPAKNIKNLNGFIRYFIRQVSPSPTSPAPPPSQKSHFFTPSHPPPPTPSPGVSGSSSDDNPTTENHRRPLSASRSESVIAANRGTSPQLVALGELEFRKAFVILNYLGKNKLEDMISVESILSWKHSPMKDFEYQVWNAVGVHCGAPEDRLKGVDWDSGKAYYYHCHVYPDGSYVFKGPYLSRQRTHLQRVLGDDNVLNVKFAEGGILENDIAVASYDYRTTLHRIAKEGIRVALRFYQFFVYKDGGKEEKKKNPTSSPVKCYFVRVESNAASEKKDSYILSNKTVTQARCLFMHIHMVNMAKYMARFSLILSKTMQLDDLEDVTVDRIDDVCCKDDDDNVVYSENGEPLIHTDGTGFISEDLALRCPLNVFKGASFDNEDSKRLLDGVRTEDKILELRLVDSVNDPPLLIQVRMFYNGLAVKGTLLINRKLPDRTIQIRPSMIKVEADAKLSNIKTVNSLEIVSTSKKPKKGHVSKYLLALLSYGGVPKGYFLSILDNALEESKSIYSNKRAALRVSLQYGEMDDFCLTKMILSGIPLNEPCLQYRLSVLSNDAKKCLREGKLPLTESYHLMGTVDPTGMLHRNEVCIILDNGQISGKVLVFKHPGLHFGDIHVLNATYVKALEDFVGNAKFGIFFPIKGPRSLADEMANSDFDGDMYWVSRDPQLLDYYNVSEPWTPLHKTKGVAQQRPSEFSPEELEHELFELFLKARFQASSAVGVAADSWLAFMDRLLTLGDDCAEEKECVKRNMLQLVDIYYEALDASKSGLKVTVPNDLVAQKFPHFMDRENRYKSRSILGLIYDAVESFEESAVAAKDLEEIWTIPCFSEEVPEVLLDFWRNHYNQYRLDMVQALNQYSEFKDQMANGVIEKYKKLLYGAAEFKESSKNLEEIFNEALAIYQVTYGFAKERGSVKYCHFAWKVAGSALCKLYAIKQGERSITCSASVLRELFN